MIIVCLACNITLPRRRGSRPDGTRFVNGSGDEMSGMTGRKLIQNQPEEANQNKND